MGRFDIIYTGVNSAERIPDLKVLREAEQNFYETIERKDQEAYERKKAGEKELLDLSKTDPKLLITDSNRKEQADLLEKYNNAVAKMTMDARGAENLTMNDKLKIRQMRDAVDLYQNKLLGDQNRYLQEAEVMQKDHQGFYDRDIFNEAQREFYKTGKYPTTGLVAAPQDFVRAINNMKLTLTQSVNPVTEEVGGVGWRRDVTTNMTMDEAKGLIRDTVLSNQGYMSKLIKDASSAQYSKEVDKYLMQYDDNKNNIIDPQEKEKALSQPLNLDNPLLLWAQDHYAPQIITQRVGASKRITSTQSGSGGYELNYGSGKTKYSPPVSENQTLGTVNYEYFPWYKKIPMSVPLNGARVLSEQKGEYALRRDKSVQGLDFVGVGKRDNGAVDFIFKLPSDNYMNIDEFAGTNIAIPAEQMSSLQNITVEYNGKLVRVKDLMRGASEGATVTTTQTSESKSKKKKWNPETKQFE